MKRLTLLAAAGLLLAGCGSIHPGDAAVVDGTSISMGTLDDTARVYCTITAQSAQQQGVQSIDNADIRRQAVTDLVLHQVAKDLVKERGLKVDQALVDLGPQQTQQLADQFGDDTSDVVDVITDSRELYAMLVAIGSDESGQPATPDDLESLATTGQQTVQAAIPDHDVRFAPRLGISKDGVVTGGIGSLSVMPPSLDVPTGDELPAALQCRA